MATRKSQDVTQDTTSMTDEEKSFLKMTSKSNTTEHGGCISIRGMVEPIPSFPSHDLDQLIAKNSDSDMSPTAEEDYVLDGEHLLNRLASDAINVAMPTQTNTEFNFSRCVKTKPHRLNWCTVGAVDADVNTRLHDMGLANEAILSSSSESSSCSDFEGSINLSKACAGKPLSTILSLDKDENLFGLASFYKNNQQPIEWKKAEDVKFPQSPVVQVCCQQSCCGRSRTDLPSSLRPCCRVPLSSPPCFCGKCCVPSPPCKFPTMEVSTIEGGASNGAQKPANYGPSPCIPPGECQPAPPCQPCGPCVGLKITMMDPVPKPCNDKIIVPTCTCTPNKPFEKCPRKASLPCNPKPACFKLPPPPPTPCCAPCRPCCSTPPPSCKK